MAAGPILKKRTPAAPLRERPVLVGRVVSGHSTHSRSPHIRDQHWQDWYQGYIQRLRPEELLD